MYINKSPLYLLLVVAILLGCAHGDAEGTDASSTVQLKIFGASSRWWLAVKPQNDNSATSKVELQDATMANFASMDLHSSWGYYTLSPNSGSGFSTPITFRLTSNAGAQITVRVTSITADSIVDTGASYGGTSTSAPTSAPSSAPTSAPTSAPSSAPTSAPTSAPSSAPTSAPTSAPSSAPTSAPTSAPSSAPTSKPTSAPSSAPTSAPSSAPTSKPTSAPSSAPTSKPSAPTSAPTSTPSSAPTSAPTSKPTSAPTSKPSSAPTTAPTSKPSSAPTTPPSSTDACAIVPTSTEPVKLLVPLYMYPGAAWDTVIAQASSVNIIAIINPSSGPLTTVDSTYSTYMTKLKNAGIEMVGYVYTSYGARALSAVQADIDTYASKYPLVTGIFLDEGANSASQIPFYTQVYNYIKSKPGYQQVILNPGVLPDQGYLAITTNIVIFEDYASSLSGTSFSSWVKCAPSSAQKSGYQYKFSGIVHTAAASNQASYISTLHNLGIGLVYITDGEGGCCTYNTLASYFAQEAASAASLQ